MKIYKSRNWDKNTGRTEECQVIGETKVRERRIRRKKNQKNEESEEWRIRRNLTPRSNWLYQKLWSRQNMRLFYHVNERQSKDLIHCRWHVTLCLKNIRENEDEWTRIWPLHCPSLKCFRAERCTGTPANSTFSGPITHLPSMLCSLMKPFHIPVRKRRQKGLNPFTAPACKISGLKIHGHPRKQSIFWLYNTSTFIATRSDENPFTFEREKENRKA